MPKEAKLFATPSATHPSRPELVGICISGLFLEALPLPRFAKVPKRPRVLRGSGSKVRKRIGKGIEKGVGKMVGKIVGKMVRKMVGKMVGKMAG